jgi:RNA 3'-terminal phosphate cyclase (ATP)
VLEVSGGTHNPLAPPFDFLEHVYAPLLRKLGVDVECELSSFGFYPAGGGGIRFQVSAPPRLLPLELLHWAPHPAIEAWAIAAQVPLHVAERELGVVRAELGVAPERTRALSVRSAGPGNVVCIRIGEYELVTAFGERGVPAEEVARRAVDEARTYLSRRAPVGEHLADQLILPLAFAGGTFRTGPLSSHAETNISVVRAFLGADAVQRDDEANDIVRLHFPGRATEL